MGCKDVIMDRIEIIAPYVGKISYPIVREIGEEIKSIRDMALFIDYDARKLLDHYSLFDSRGQIIFYLSTQKQRDFKMIKGD